MKRIFCLFCAVALMVSCSVKEDRMPCPAYIHPMVSEFPDDGDVLVTVKMEGRLIYQEIVTRDEFENPDYEIMVPRGYLDVAVTTGIDKMVLKSADVLSTDRVSEADKLSSYNQQFYVTKEKENVVAKPEKQFTRVYFDILGESPDFEMTVGGDWAGMNAFTMASVRGPYSVNITKDMIVNGEYVFVMARQGDYTLKLFINEPGKSFRTIELGELIQKAGYQIDAPVLADVHVTIDLTRGIISIKVGDWGEIVSFNIVTI